MSRIKVLVVDDSVVVRRLVTDVLAGDERIEVVCSAANGRVALAKIPQLNPDLITLDIEMPIMDGLETLEALRADYPHLPVIMFSTLTERGATATLDALERGARDYVTKPANVGSVTASMEAVRRDLVPKILGLCRDDGASGSLPRPRLGTTATRSSTAADEPRSERAGGPRPPVELLAIGVSTGGPDALSSVLAELPGNLRVPVVVVQHMPPVFTKQFAARLDTRCALRVVEARSGDPVEAGTVLIAPGDFHMRVRRTGGRMRVELDQGTAENYCRPAVDVLFRSVAESHGAGVLAVVLTGMGSDGARGAGDIVRAGGSVLVQDEATSVVWGMPGATVAAGLADRILPLPRIAPEILVRLGKPARRPVESTALTQGAVSQ